MDYEETLEFVKKEIDLYMMELDRDYHRLDEVQYVGKVADALTQFGIYWEGFYHGLAYGEVEYNILTKLRADTIEYFKEKLDASAEMANTRFRWDAMVEQVVCP